MVADAASLAGHVYRRELTAGPLRALFDDGDLQYLTVGGSEVVRRLYVAVRDAAWGTVAPVLRDVRVVQRADGFDVDFDAAHGRDGIEFEWHGRVTAHASSGSAAGEDAGAVVVLRYEMDGVARTTFRTCRTGVCVLHPVVECAGLPCTIEHPDGSSEESRFPLLIAPHQPFTDIRSLRHSPQPGGTVTLEFEGEVFEMEDQRNWGDASYKTYCRPLSQPSPYELRAGERVRQAVTVRIAGNPVAGREEADWVELLHDHPMGPVPKLGVALGEGGEPREDPAGCLRQLRLAHLRCDVRPGEPGWDGWLARALRTSPARSVPNWSWRSTLARNRRPNLPTSPGASRRWGCRSPDGWCTRSTGTWRPTPWSRPPRACSAR